MANHIMSERWALALKHPVVAKDVDCERGYGFRYIGHADTLIAAGLARREWLPGQPDCPTKYSFATVVDGPKVNLRRAPKGLHRYRDQQFLLASRPGRTHWRRISIRPGHH